MEHGFHEAKKTLRDDTLRYEDMKVSVDISGFMYDLLDNTEEKLLLNFCGSNRCKKRFEVN